MDSIEAPSISPTSAWNRARGARARRTPDGAPSRCSRRSRCPRRPVAGCLDVASGRGDCRWSGLPGIQRWRYSVHWLQERGIGYRQRHVEDSRWWERKRATSMSTLLSAICPSRRMHDVFVTGRNKLGALGQLPNRRMQKIMPAECWHGYSILGVMSGLVNRHLPVQSTVPRASLVSRPLQRYGRCSSWCSCRCLKLPLY